MGYPLTFLTVFVFVTFLHVRNRYLGSLLVLLFTSMSMKPLYDHCLHIYIMSGVCHQADIPTACDAVERQGAAAGGAQWAQRAPGRIHGDQRGRLAHHPEQLQPDPARGHRQAAAHPQYWRPENSHEDCE